MDRLTYRLNDQCDNPTDSIILKPYLRYEDPETRNKILNCLAAYEDSGLEPEDLKKAFNETAILKLAAQALSTTPDHLRDLLQAEQDGRLVALPCKVGDSIYIPDLEKKIPVKVRVQGISIPVSGRTILHFGVYPFECEWGDGCRKDCFFTREEAEEALKGGEG